MCGNSYRESHALLAKSKQIAKRYSRTSPFPNSSAKMSQTNSCTGLHKLVPPARVLSCAQRFCASCPNRPAQPPADRSPHSSAFCPSTNFALQLPTSSKLWGKPPTGQPPGAALGQSKPLPLHNRPSGGSEGWRKSFGLSPFPSAGAVGAARELTYPGAGEPAHRPVLAAVLESRAAAAPGVFLLHHPVLQPSASQGGVHRETIT